MEIVRRLDCFLDRAQKGCAEKHRELRLVDETTLDTVRGTASFVEELEGYLLEHGGIGEVNVVPLPFPRPP